MSDPITEVRSSAKVWQPGFAPKITSLAVRLLKNVRNNCVPFLL